MGSVLFKLKMHSQTNCLLSLGISCPWEGQSLQGQQALRYQNLKIQKIKKHGWYTGGSGTCPQLQSQAEVIIAFYELVSEVM